MNKELMRAKDVIMTNLDEHNSCTVRSKRTGKEFIIVRQYNAYDGWFLYEGCDLIVGDTTFDYAVRVLLDVTR
jgi:hypothetical protein